jgi:hypothetical protein
MAGLDPAIQSLFASPTLGGWMAAARAAMTERQNRPLSGGEKRPVLSYGDIKEMRIAFVVGPTATQTPVESTSQLRATEPRN